MFHIFVAKTVVVSLVVVLLTGSTVGSRVELQRGVSLTKNVFYDSTKDFTCLDGSRTMPFFNVNDDYCDCTDGSDEPGTSACPDGQFHCTNAGFRPLNIPSSRVNDGICDCCDGSDEWANETLCPDVCKELWKVAKEDLQRQAEAASRGVQIRKEYSDRSLTKKRENQEKLEALKRKIEEIKQSENELFGKKADAENIEKEAKDEEQLAWDNFKEKVEQQQESRQAADAFTELDTNNDGSISASELQFHTELDANEDDGTFTEDEAKSILGGRSVEAPHFIEVTWQQISDKFVQKPIDTETTESPPIPVEDDHDDPDEDEHDDPDEDDRDDPDEDDRDDPDEDDPDDEDEEHEDYQDDEDHSDYEPDLDDDLDDGELESADAITLPPESIPPLEDKPDQTTEKISKINLPSEPVWSVATRTLIDAADNARREHDESTKRKADAAREISLLEKKLTMDFGPDEAYQELHGNCYELNTHEYVYQLCPFDKAVQNPKGGGSETSLGRWGTWNGPENNKYSSMKYPNGLGCWNGPERSTEVKIMCGDENKLLSVSEPSRCEYRFEFATPAACQPIHVPEKPHDEL